MTTRQIHLGKLLYQVAWLAFCQMSGFRFTPRPLIFIFEINDICNSRCCYCDVWERTAESDETLGSAEAKGIIDKAAALGVFCISFTGGGEPLLRKDLPSLVTHAKNLGLQVALTTNGLLINENNVHDLLQADIITVSIDTLNGRMYEARRGVPGGLKRVLRGLDILLAHNRDTYICIQSVIDADNWNEINTINTHFHTMGLDTIFQPVYKQHFNVPVREWRSRTDRLKYCRFTTRMLFRRFLRHIPEIADGRGAIPCLAGSFAFVVNHKGVLKVCHLNDSFCSDLRVTSLREAWRQVKPIRRYISSRERNCVCGDTAFIPYSLLLKRAK